MGDRAARDGFLRAARVEAETLEAEIAAGRIDPDKVALLAELRSLAPHRDPPRRQWPIAVMMLVSAVVLSVLFFVRMPSTRVDVSATGAALSFRTTADGELRIPEPLTKLDAAPVTVRAAGMRLEGGDCATPAQVGLDFPAGRATDSSLTVGAVATPGGSGVDVVHMGDTRRYSVTITPPADKAVGDVAVGAAGAWRATRGECVSRSDGPPPRLVTLLPDQGRPLTLEMTPETAPPADAASLEIADVSFAVFPDGPARDTSRRPMLRSGTLRLLSLGDKSRELREGDDLRLIGFKGSLDLLRSDTNDLVFRVRGTTRRISIGDSADITPTVFEWLSARHALFALWGAVAYVGGLAFSLWRWWKAGVP